MTRFSTSSFRHVFLAGFASIVIALVGCKKNDTTTTDAGTPRDSGAAMDSAVIENDAGSANDAAVEADTGVADAGSVTDGAIAHDDAGTGPGGLACSGATPTFADVYTVLQNHCGGPEGCHGLVIRNPSNAYASFLLGASSCADARPNVTPSDISHSFILNKLTNTDLCPDSPDPMPKGLAIWVALDMPDIQTVTDWICNGAPGPT